MIELTGWTRDTIFDEDLQFLVRLVAGDKPDDPFRGRPFVRSLDEAVQRGWLGNGRGQDRVGGD